MRVYVTDIGGDIHEIAAIPGLSLMLAIKEAGLPLRAECGGSCLCSTCHVYVAEDWRNRLPAMTSDEDMTLSEGVEISEASRLACQIEMTSNLDGLHVTIGPTFL